MLLIAGIPISSDSVFHKVKRVDDWWSEGDGACRGGGLGYWLAVSPSDRRRILREFNDHQQKVKLIEFWLEMDTIPSWHWLRRALIRVGHPKLASQIEIGDEHAGMLWQSIGSYLMQE